MSAVGTEGCQEYGVLVLPTLLSAEAPRDVYLEKGSLDDICFIATTLEEENWGQSLAIVLEAKKFVHPRMEIKS